MVHLSSLDGLRHFLIRLVPFFRRPFHAVFHALYLGDAAQPLRIPHFKVSRNFKVTALLTLHLKAVLCIFLTKIFES